MSYCINPWCTNREQVDQEILSVNDCCETCGTKLLVKGRYRLIRPLRNLDEWGASEVFEVDDRGERKVLKLLKQKIFQPQFKREAETLKTLEDLGVPKVEADGYFDLEVANQRKIYCLVMEKIQGVSLDAYLRENGSIDQAKAIDWMFQLVMLLGDLREKKFLHRDIKLSNIMLRQATTEDASEQLALIDFGTVRRTDTKTYRAMQAGSRDITSVVSPGYTPLEQINGRAEPRSDFYALGRTMVHLLTNKHPIDLPIDEPTGMIEWKQETVYPVSTWFVQLLDNMMAPMPSQRPLDAGKILTRLKKQKLQSEGITSRIKLLTVANVCLLILQLFLGFSWMNKAKNNPAAPTPVNGGEQSLVIIQQSVTSA